MNKTQRLTGLIPIVLCLTCSSPESDQIQKAYWETLPESAQTDILWQCDWEDQSFRKWEDAGTDDYYSGGGIFLTDEMNSDYGIEDENVHTGKYAAFARIQNALTPNI